MKPMASMDGRHIKETVRMTDMKIETLESFWTIIDGIRGVSVHPKDISIMDAIEDYGFEGICSIVVEYGWAARFTMSGYVDCTEWAGVFDSEDQCVENLKNMFEED